MIEYRHADATNPDVNPVVIAHVVNDVGAFGAGFSGALARRWWHAEASYRRWTPVLGRILPVTVMPGVAVTHLCAQRGIGTDQPRIDYDALETCLAGLHDHWALTGATFAGCPIWMPRIGCGLAGGRWSEVEPIIARRLDGIRVVVCDFP